MDGQVSATIVRGHKVASGLKGDSRFPGGTIFIQAPHFLARGLDLASFHSGTLNVSISPWRYRIMQPRYTFRAVKWHQVEPAEDFSFFDVQVMRSGMAPISGLIYFPHPDTKPEHFQEPDVLELLLPWTEGLGYDLQITLAVPKEQMVFELPSS